MLSESLLSTQILGNLIFGCFGCSINSDNVYAGSAPLPESCHRHVYGPHKLLFPWMMLPCCIFLQSEVEKLLVWLEVWTVNLRFLFSVRCLLFRDGPWPDLTQANFWPTVIKRLTRLWPRYFWPESKIFFLIWRQKIEKFNIFRGNFLNPNHKWLTRPGSKFFDPDPSLLWSLGNSNRKMFFMKSVFLFKK